MSISSSRNMARLDPYKSYRFLIYFGQSTSPVAAASKVTGLRRASAPLDCKEKSDTSVRKSSRRTQYEAITIERGITHDADFLAWASAAQEPDEGTATQSPTILRRDIRIERLDEAGQAVVRYMVRGAWVSEFEALPDLDPSGNEIALERVKLEHEGWKRCLARTRLLGV